MHPSDAFDQGLDEVAARAEDVKPLVVDLDGYEGPLDVLLVLARGQKVDLAGISILQLAEQAPIHFQVWGQDSIESKPMSRFWSTSSMLIAVIL